MSTNKILTTTVNATNWTPFSDLKIFPWTVVRLPPSLRNPAITVLIDRFPRQQILGCFSAYKVLELFTTSIYKLHVTLRALFLDHDTIF